MTEKKSTVRTGDDRGGPGRTGILSAMCYVIQVWTGEDWYTVGRSRNHVVQVWTGEDWYTVGRSRNHGGRRPWSYINGRVAV